ncbi:hypothetical protein C3747_143g123 [Trypanosoma cruzi]|uniref:Cation transporter n=2 Tax=Trypanosoma cruzi TaxID=5693 RepID=Q4DEL5_TRYCC|nr:uncharacterized protein Tc00.1047053507941.110 [Trypanosoma cruzi]EAN90971.1 hypothetical protein, conserved [Trypanosoma cruzi]PWV04798.1 hypothetical protein C3747_143g123 [Trypanosoma cruzi]|eukprot:XP_812822.1 hypothetical protein Tc00.1047053507941.110 [Trypanosoma cruzi strain CL Brener]
MSRYLFELFFSFFSRCLCISCCMVSCSEEGIGVRVVRGDLLQLLLENCAWATARMSDVALFKIGVALSLTSVTVLGMCTPFLCVQNAKGNTPPRPRTQLMTSPRPLSLANCFSAGTLLAISLVHFMPCALATAGNGVSPTALCAALMIGVLFPALIERNITESVAQSGYGHSHGLFLAHESYQRLTVMPLIMLPMCFHAAVEGVLLGLEASVAALMGSAVPLFVHRFFDGVVVGVCIAKEVRAEMEAVDEVTPLNAAEKNTTAGDFAATFRRRTCRFPIILWLCIMPAALLFCVVLTGNFHVHGVSEALHRGGLTRPSDGAESHLRSSWHKESKWLALTQAVGSGFFLYASLTTLTLEELKGTRASLALFAGVLFTSLLGAMETH